VPLKIGSENALLRGLGLDVDAHREAISHGNSYDVHSPIDLAAALEPSTSQSWYWYSGGPTTPSMCPDWGVKWLVMETPLEVSLDQLNSLHLPVSGVDSTVMAKPIDAQSIVRSSVPEHGLKLGTCSSNDDFQNDPACWAASNPTCGSGMAQSPINIETASVSQVGSESFLAKASWKPVGGLRLINDGNSLGFESSQMGYSTLIGPNGFPKFYQVASVALRMPSEHLIDGKQYPAELQIIHKNQKTVLELEDNDAVIASIMFDFGEESKFLKQMLPEAIPAPGTYVTLEQPVDLQWALGPAIDGPFFKYDGSYTTPGCAEDASWAVFETPMTLSMEQWKAFKAAFPNPGNNRPVQALNGRTIAKNTMEEAEAINYKFFLNREIGRDKRETRPALILFPIVGTILLCSTVMTATFRREESKTKAESAGGLEQKPTTYGRGYNQF
jgi:carbonic anhydrase